MPERFGSTRAVVALGALSLSTFAYVTTETLPIGLLPLIAHDLGRSTSAIGLLVTAYGLVVVVASIPLTRLTQRIDRRRLLCGLLALFVVATAVSALAQGYWMLLVARLVIALSQALFWAVVTPAAAALFRSSVRPRALSILYAGSSVGALAGVPAGTWLGQQTSWRVAFLALSAIGLAILTTIAVLLPAGSPGASDADRGSAPDRGRYWAIVTYTALAVTGAFTSFTYINPFFRQVSGFGEGAVGPLLFVRGFAGLIGVFVVGYLVGRNGWRTMTGLIGAQAVALAGMWAFGDSRMATVLSICVSGFALAALSAGLGARVLEVAPGSSDLAAAGASTAFNVGITVGAFAGSLLLPAFGVRSTPLAGALVTLAALAVALAEPRLSTRRHPKPVDQASADQAADQAAADQGAADQAADQAPADQTADQAPADQAADQAPADQAADQAPTGKPDSAPRVLHLGAVRD
jgi:DHA1 family inner membrane transport protein